MKLLQKTKRTHRSSQLSFRKLGMIFLFFCFFHFSAQIHISEGTIVHIENGKDLYVSNSENRTSEIYIASGAEIVNLDDAKYTVVKASKLEKKSSEKILAKKEAPEKEKIKELSRKVAPKNKIVFANLSDLDVFSEEFYKTGFTLVSGCSAASKIIEAFPKNNLNTIHFLQKQSEVFLYSDFTISNYHLTSLSVRPPPFFI